MSARRLIGFLVLCLAFAVVRQAGAAECPDHCSEERVEFFEAIHCDTPGGVLDDASCGHVATLLLRTLDLHGHRCDGIPLIWVDDRSTLTSIACVNAAYGVWFSSVDLRVLALEPIKNAAMWGALQATARAFRQ